MASFTNASCVKPCGDAVAISSLVKVVLLKPKLSKPAVYGV